MARQKKKSTQPFETGTYLKSRDRRGRRILPNWQKVAQMSFFLPNSSNIFTEQVFPHNFYRTVQYSLPNNLYRTRKSLPNSSLPNCFKILKSLPNSVYRIVFLPNKKSYFFGLFTELFEKMTVR